MTILAAKFQGRIGAFNLDAAFDLRAGVTGLFGPSGCGKTTILRCIAGLTRLPGASLRVGNSFWQDETHFLAPHKRPLGYVFQDPRLFAHLTVADNLRYGMRRIPSGISPPELDAMVERLGLRHLLERAPGTLSGGERQRVAIGRALLTKPELLLMDEPVSALDRAAKEEILRSLEAIVTQLAIPVIYVSHDLSELERHATHLVLMRQNGTIQAAGQLQALLADLSLPFARLPDAGAVLSVVVADYDAAYDLSQCQCGNVTFLVPGNLGPPGTQRRLRVRASDVSLTKALPPDTSVLNILPARIIAAEAAANQMLVLLQLGESRLLSSITRKSWDMLALRENMPVFAQVKGMALAD